jgi:hypothetical protein
MIKFYYIDETRIEHKSKNIVVKDKKVINKALRKKYNNIIKNDSKGTKYENKF